MLTLAGGYAIDRHETDTCARTPRTKQTDRYGKHTNTKNSHKCSHDLTKKGEITKWRLSRQVQECNPHCTGYGLIVSCHGPIWVVSFCVVPVVEFNISNVRAVFSRMSKHTNVEHSHVHQRRTEQPHQHHTLLLQIHLLQI